MNQYLFGVVRVANGMAKKLYLKIVHRKNVSIKGICFLSPYTEITVEKRASLYVDEKWKMRSASKLRVRNGSAVSIGKNFNMGNGCIITCRKSISIGDNVSFGPGVMVYDHDHDYANWPSKEYKMDSILIGDNVWIGANCIILKGAEIGCNSVVAAGTVVRGKYPNNSLIYQEKKTLVKTINKTI